MSSRSKSPKRVSEAERQMKARLEEYQRKRNARVNEKEKTQAEKKAEEEARRKAEEERRKRYQSPTRRARSKSPVPVNKPKPTSSRPRSKSPMTLNKPAQVPKKENKAAPAEKAAQQAQKKEQAQKNMVAAGQAQKKAADARMKKWKEQEAKRKAQATKTGDTPVERVPKLSALLAMGGPEAEEYKKKAALAKLGTWQSNAGDKWKIVEHTFDGVSMSEVTKKETVKDIPVEEAVETFKTNPEKYLAMYYWPDHPNQYTFILRAGTVGYEPQGIRTDGGGKYAIWRHLYQRLPPMKEDVLPANSRDKYTDSMTFGGKKLHNGKKKHKPVLPGRGMGIGDEANMEMIGEFAQPGDIRQGVCVGDCWLLSAIACLADFDWAVQRLFQKTKLPSLQDRPQDQPNQYTVTLWDLKTWKQVDVVVDERLPVRADGSGYLLGAKPSKDGKLWVPYLEKAIAAHCGGYDKLNGGQCTDAWPMLTGSRNQFLIAKNPKTGKYTCSAKYNPLEQKWSDHRNSPHDCDPTIWRVDWPKVGGGGDSEHELNEEELFSRVIAWDENNYLIGAATGGASDKESTDGIVDNHAYSIIDSRQNICGTGIDLLLIRNPWGEGGELKNGQFMRSGPGWDGYPDIKKELNPATEDNGLCWVTKKEFFKYFPTIYICALNMTRLKDNTYVNDLKDNFKRRPKTAPKPLPKPAPKPVPSSSEEGKPIYVNKSSDPSSPYKIVEQSFNGGVAFMECNKKTIKGPIPKGVDEFRANPEKYLAIWWQNNMCEDGWPPEQHRYTLIFRDGTDGLEAGGTVAKGGKKTMLTNVLR